MKAKHWTYIGRAASALGLLTAILGMARDAATLIAIGALVVSCGALAVAHAPDLLRKLLDEQRKDAP